jgi:hypothetical protein
VPTIKITPIIDPGNKLLAAAMDSSGHGVTAMVASDAETSASRAADWLDDHQLSSAERARCGDFAVPRVGHARRRCWPADEVRAVLGQDQ